MNSRDEPEHRPHVAITYIGGPTALIEIGDLRFLTDPTFDPAGQEYDLGRYRLRKTAGPLIDAGSLGRVDAVLLSHDHHVDNLDLAGRRLILAASSRVLTTVAGAERLGHGAMGLQTWQTIEMAAPSGLKMSVTAVPARHGPERGDRGPVTGFVLSNASAPGGALYISGDTVWFSGVSSLSERFQIETAILFMGAAVVREVGPSHLTFTAAEAIEFARTFTTARIIPLHFEGWEHLTESKDEIADAFERSGLSNRLFWLDSNRRTVIPVTGAY